MCCQTVVVQLAVQMAELAAKASVMEGGPTGVVRIHATLSNQRKPLQKSIYDSNS